MASHLAHLTACPKADKQWHIFETGKRIEPSHPSWEIEFIAVLIANAGRVAESGAKRMAPRD